MKDGLEVVVADAFGEGVKFGGLQMCLGAVGIELLPRKVGRLVPDLGKNAVAVGTVDLVQLHAPVEIGGHDPSVVL